MKNIVVTGLFFLIVACGNLSEPYIPKQPVLLPVVSDTVDCNERAKEIFDLINIYYKSSNGLYKESYPTQSGDPTYSYLWPYVAQVSGAAKLAQIGYDVNFISMVDVYQKYYRLGANGNKIGGYGSSTNGFTGGGTRYYDDNSIVGISLVEAYSITKEQRFLDRAAQVLTFLESGVDSVLGGGIWWNENDKNIVGNGNSNKPTCANGYATLFLLDYYFVCQAAQKSSVLSFAKLEYAWLKTNLRDPGDKCYWNDKNASGIVGTTKWAYNTGVMIQNGVRLYRITGEQMYLEDAIESAKGSFDYFVKTRNNVTQTYPDNDPWFNTKLLRGYIDLSPYYKNADSYVKAYYNFMNYGYEHARTEYKFFYEDWTGINTRRYYLLLMQAAVVESYGSLSIYYK